MQDVETLHQEAMALVDQAMVARQRCNLCQIAALSRDAFEKDYAEDRIRFVEA
jgi:hypothetical protein